MEIQSTNGSKTRLKPDSTTEFGRKNLPISDDLTISRNHILFSPINQTNPRVSFQVTGKNPVWVYSKNEGKKVKTLKRFEKGELGIGDFFCVSGRSPVWFVVKEVKEESFEGKLSESLDGNYEFDGGFDFELDSVDVSNINPVQEFGFLVIGHEFDQYPKKMIRDINNWDWFLNDPIQGSDSEDDESAKGNTRKSRKRKKTSGDDDMDDEWTAESEGEELTTKVQKPKYHTRSKDPDVSDKKRTNKKTFPGTSSKHEEVEEDEDEDDEVDETLGGFIVNDENVDEGNEIDDEEEEEEFVEDEDEELEE